MNTVSTSAVNTVSLDKAKIKAATDASQTATVTMVALGLRQRAHHFTNLLAVKNELIHKYKEKIIDKDYMAFWKALEEAGAGSLILGRRGGQTRFEWNYSLRQIAQITIENRAAETVKRFIANGPQKPVNNVLAMVTKPLAEATAKEVLHAKVAALPAKMLVRSVKIRPDFTAQIVLPEDITPGELMRITSELIIGYK